MDRAEILIFVCAAVNIGVYVIEMDVLARQQRHLAHGTRQRAVPADHAIQQAIHGQFSGDRLCHFRAEA